ncbi:uncharacterized protein [Rutidosis leptorrhynchoides]|uniref:uncharacterized protein n=1 Tax=Rutidosis leptorrhynchoides TaxID=125765 RepID=UPI003A98EC56
MKKRLYFSRKIKNFKSNLKSWSIRNFGKLDSEKNSLQKEAGEWKKKAELNDITDGERVLWLEYRKKWIEKDKVKAKMLRQKARIRWVLEGDENLEFFHSSIKRKYSKCNIRGLNINGVWNENPSEVKNAILEHFKLRFQKSKWARPEMAGLEFSSLAQFGHNRFVVNRPVGSYDSGPFQDSILGLIPPGNSSSDSNFGLKWEESRLLEKEFTEGEILEAIKCCASSKAPGPDGFNLRFYKKKIWDIIRADLTEAIKFFLEKGLNWIAKVAVQANLFARVEVGQDKVPISHLQYADDTIFFGKWSVNNIVNLMKLLKCFELSSGLKINYHKSSLFGVGLEHSEVIHSARLIGCKVVSFPCIYLGLPVGAKMSKKINWKPVIDKFEKRLADWKARAMSFGGRLTLINSVLNSLPLYYFSLFHA